MTDSSRRWQAPGSWDLIAGDDGSGGLAMPWNDIPAPITQIVFIDGSVPQAQELAKGVQPGVVAVVLDPGSDGVQQIADWLATHHVQGAGAIDIVAHGADGELQLGNTLLSSATMASYQTQLAQIGSALRPGGDIQLYGCDVAQDAAGDAFLQQLSQATGGANIAASSHLVGGAAGGGSWNLNVDVGTIDVGNPFTAATINNFTNELALTSDQLFFTVENGSLNNTGDRVEQISVNGTNAATNPIDLADGSSDSNAIDLVNGVAVDAPLQKFFIANSNTSGNGYNYYGLFRGVTNPSGANQSLTQIYSAPHDGTNSVNGIILGVALDQPNGQLYFAQVTSDFTNGTYVANETGIFKISVTNTTAVSQLVTLGASSTPHDIAVDTKDNLVFFTAEDFNSGGITGVELDAVNLTTGGNFHQLATIAGAGFHPGGVAVNGSSHNAYFTVLNAGTAADNDIFKISFNVSGSGSSAAVSSQGSLGTLYAGAKAEVPQGITIDPADGVFFTAGETLAGSEPEAVVFAGSLTNSNTNATLTPVFSISSILGTTAGNPPTSLVLDSTPTISASGTVTYAQGGAAVALDTGLTVSDQEGDNILSATVVIGSFLTGDTLAATTTSTNIFANFSSGTLTLTGTGAAGGDTLANFQSVLDSVKYSTTNTNPTSSGSADTRTISWTINDGVVTSTTPTTTLDIHAAFISAGATATFNGGGTAVALDSSLTLGDSVGTNFNSATVTIGSFVTGDTLNFTTQNGISQSSFNNGTLILTGSASFANYQTALRSITYGFTAGGDPTNGGSATSRTISWVVNDGTVVSPTASSTLNLVHAAPTIQTSGTVTYPESGVPVVLDSSITITAPDSSNNLTKATVAITSGFLGTDTLTVGSNPGSLSISAFTSGTLTLTGTSSVSNYLAALESVRFSNSGDPTNGNTDNSRTITWTVNDGVSTSSSSTSSVATLCFCAGTRIATPTGEILVERLAIGDPVLTVEGRTVPIRWIGTGQSLLPPGRRTDATPVIVRAGALADGVPRRDLRITKGHSLFLEGMLVPVESLINHRSILWDDEASSVVVHHIELDRHEVLLADGAPAESYRDDGNRVQFQNTNPAWDVRPPLQPYAPIVDNGPAVHALWHRLLQRAAPRASVAVTDEPDLHLLVDGIRLEPLSVERGIFTFELAVIGQQTRIASRSGIPSELGVNCDHRPLGVAVERIVLRQSGTTLELAAESPLLTNGFYDYEAHGNFRWTDGAALLPAQALQLFAGSSLTVELHVACTARYPADRASLAFAA